MKCSVEDCPDPIKAKGLCSRHYQRQWHYNRLNLLYAPKGSYTGLHCTIEGCPNPIACKGLCQRHYRRKYRLDHREQENTYKRNYRKNGPYHI